MQKFRKFGLRFLSALFVLYVLLLIPSNEKNTVVKPVDEPFAWNQDAVWQMLEKDFVQAKQQGKQQNDSLINDLFRKENDVYNTMLQRNSAVADTSLSIILNHYFKLAALIAAAPAQRDSFINYYSKIRALVKTRSQQWPVTDRDNRNDIYRLLYGMRAAAEEVLLQTAAVPFNPVVFVKDEPSAAPSSTIFGIKVHSGDLLVSRGGAEVSALISRGNNYPGNFSHVAVLYIDEKSNIPYLVEAHIEKGVAISSAEQYIKDKKLRFMVLRPDASLPPLKADPLLPHKAAKAAYNEALSRHIPYDFKMNFYDSTALFCSEVASHAYQQMGIQLWQASSHISSPGVVNWLSDFGVEHFVTQMPSDLEYDPQLSVVAEWRNPETLAKDHLDNAVMDALLEAANSGKKIEYNHWQLPLVRLVKLYCIIKNYCGGVGIIPEGMSATRALKNQYFVAMYQKVKTATALAVTQFIKEKGYNPPYWQLVAMAKNAAKNN